MASTPFHPWMPFGSGPDNAGTRLFCLPFAGGGASNFLGWRKLLPDIGVAPVQYPGHETRLDEAPLEHLDQMIDGLVEAIAPLLDRPYMVFGYSMGAKLGFGLVQRLEQLGLPAPLCLLVGAHLPPDRKSGAARAIGLPDPEFKQVLREFGGMPEELFEDEDFCAMALPVLRADFSLSTQAIPFDRIACPILAYAGTDDATAGAAEMAGWQRFTEAQCSLREFVGGHFFLRSAPDFEAALAADLDEAMRWADIPQRVAAF
jgi:medium-chain acyl-[acyl-carrier-protein] hydrolase